MLKSLLPKFLRPKPKNNGTKTAKAKPSHRKGGGALKGYAKDAKDTVVVGDVGLDEIKRKRQPEWLVDSVLPLAGKTMLIGESGVGKTMLTADIAISVAAGAMALNRFQARQGRVFIHTPEMDPGYMKNRILNAAEARGINPCACENIRFSAVKSGSLEIDTVPGQAALEKKISDGKYDLLIIDPLVECIAGSENSQGCSGSVAKFMTRLSEEYGVTSLIVHHVTDGRARGSGVWRSYPDMGLMLERKNGIVVFSRTKERETEAMDMLQIVFKKTDFGVALTACDAPTVKVTDIECQIIDYLRREPLSSSRDVRKNVKKRASLVLNTMNALKKIGVIEIDEKKLWRVAGEDTEVVPDS